jgi:hypothetical protein
VDVVGDSGDDGDGEFGGPGGRREVSVRVGTGSRGGGVTVDGKLWVCRSRSR